MPRNVLTHTLESWADPVSLHDVVAAQHAYSVWLDSGPQAKSGYSFIAGVEQILFDSDALTELDEQLRTPSQSCEQIPGPFKLGWIGWFSYEFGAEIVGVNASPRSAPNSCVARVSSMFVIDHSNHVIHAVSEDDSGLTKLRAIARAASERVVTPIVAAKPIDEPVRWRHTDHEYGELVTECQREIASGNAFQLCLTNQISIDAHFNSRDVYLRLRQDNPSHHGAFLRMPNIDLLSSSPEVFLRVDAERRATTQPIKGTRPRGTTPRADQELAAELQNSSKEQAENLMIVDLMRNDLSRVCVPGSVMTSDLLHVESLPHVHQLVSTVSGQLAAGKTAWDAFRALFPAGSMTGAPKISAMKILHRLEQGPRGIYSGVFGWFGHDGACELAMVIRSLVITPNKTTIGTGGGITSDSDPHAEVLEIKIKAAAALRALGLH